MEHDDAVEDVVDGLQAAIFFTGETPEGFSFMEWESAVVDLADAFDSREQYASWLLEAVTGVPLGN